MITNELDFILLNLCTKETPAHIYRVNNHDAVEVLYYTLDFQLLLEKSIFAPIYYYKDDIQRLPLKEPFLYHKVLKNTATILSGCIIDFASYLEEKRESPCGVVERSMLRSISQKLNQLPEKEKIWCLTNDMRYGGAIGLYQLSVLKIFCHEQNLSEILIGVGNRDYAYILKNSPKNQKHIARLLESAPDIMDDNGTLEQTYLFTYDNETNKLTRIS